METTLDASANSNAQVRGRIVLIDDDPAFGALFQSHAEAAGIKCDWHESLSDLGWIGLLGRFDAVVLDCQLDTHTGDEIARYIQSLQLTLPVLMISGSDAWMASGRPWPACVKATVHKNAGLPRILDAVAALLPSH